MLSLTCRVLALFSRGKRGGINSTPSRGMVVKGRGVRSWCTRHCGHGIWIAPCQEAAG